MDRPRIKMIRAEVMEKLKEEFTYKRSRRIVALEEDIKRIEKILTDEILELTVDQVVKLTEQKRKHLQAIATELGEWQKEEPQQNQQFVVSVEAKREAMKRLGMANATPAVEGEVVREE